MAGAVALAALAAVPWAGPDQRPDGAVGADGAAGATGDGGESAVPGTSSDGGSGLDAIQRLYRGSVGELSAGEVDARLADAIGDVIGDLGTYSTRREPGELPAVASDVLRDYEDRGLELVYAGYLGVLEDTWACLVQGDRWVEISVVRDGEDGSSSKVEVIRFDADDWEDALPDELPFPEGEGKDPSPEAVDENGEGGASDDGEATGETP